jgi:bacterioferritin-associated ferredoxin
VDSRAKRKDRRKARRLRQVEALGLVDKPRETAKVTDEQLIEWATIDTDCGQCYDEFNDTVMKAKRAVEVHYKKHKGWSEETVKRWLEKLIEQQRKDWYNSNGKR